MELGSNKRGSLPCIGGRKFNFENEVSGRKPIGGPPWKNRPTVLRPAARRRVADHRPGPAAPNVHPHVDAPCGAGVVSSPPCDSRSRLSSLVAVGWTSPAHAQAPPAPRGRCRCRGRQEILRQGQRRRLPRPWPPPIRAARARRATRARPPGFYKKACDGQQAKGLLRAGRDCTWPGRVARRT